MAVLERTLAAAAQAGVLTIADAKRGDIGSTMAAYADAWLRDGSALAADSVTLSPYLGFESLRPALDLAAQTGRGVFVLALTSNPEGASVQHVGGRRLRCPPDRPGGSRGEQRYGVSTAGAGFGRPRRRRDRRLRADGPGPGPRRRPRSDPGPGPGCTGRDGGGSAPDLRRRLRPGPGTSSRDILGAGPRIKDLQAAVRRTLGELRAA